MTCARMLGHASMRTKTDCNGLLHHLQSSKLETSPLEARSVLNDILVLSHNFDPVIFVKVERNLIMRAHELPNLARGNDFECNDFSSCNMN